MTKLAGDKPLWGMGEVARLTLAGGAGNAQFHGHAVSGLVVGFFRGGGPVQAQMVGGLASFVPESFATGLLLVVNTYVAQNLARESSTAAANMPGPAWCWPFVSAS